jgi:hypothetical protein
LGIARLIWPNEPKAAKLMKKLQITGEQEKYEGEELKFRNCCRSRRG